MSESSSHVHVATPAPRRDTEVRLVTVERDVAGLKSDLGEIKSSMLTGFKEIGDQLKSKGQPNWAALAIVAGLLVPALGWGWSQLGTIQQRADASLLDTKVTFAQAIAKQEAALTAVTAEQKAALATATAKQEAASGDFMKRSDIVAMNAATEKAGDVARSYQEKIADLQLKLIDQRITRNEGLMADMAKQIVPLSTHQELWKGQADTNKGLAAQIDENRHALGDITAPKDTISRIYKRLDDVEGLARTRSSKAD